MQQLPLWVKIWAQTDPNVSPTPVGSNDNAYGPDWVQIASEGGFLP